VGKQIAGEHRCAAGLLVENDLQQDAARQILGSLRIHHLKVFMIENELLHVRQGDV
jgi:hypothetical protein